MNFQGQGLELVKYGGKIQRCTRCIFCRIPYFKGLQNKHLKQFYVRCLRLILTSTTINEFSEILSALLIVIKSETDGWVDENINTPSESSRLLLLDKMKKTYVTDNTIEDFEDDKGTELIDNDVGDEDVISTEIEQYLKSLEKDADTKSRIVGNRISPYFLPGLPI